MSRNIVLHPETGQLSAVVESYEQVELAQLEAEYNEANATVEQVQAEVDAATSRLAEAQVAAEDKKSEFEVGQGLVGQPTVSDGSVPVDVTVADPAAEL